MKTILSLGAGVQSSTMALMAAYGEIKPMPDCAIFADTQAEPGYVYEWLDWLEELLPFPIHRVSKGSLKQQILRSTTTGADGFVGRFAGAPFYTTTERGQREGMLRRQCTREFKVEPITRKVRELCGLTKGQRAPKGEILAEQWIGISLDEIQRMKEPREKWLRHRWPLIEKRVSRLQCLEWMQGHNFPLPQKSACTFCPYHGDAEWRALQNKHPADFAEAVAMDEAIRNGVRGTTQRLYVHQSLVPLKDVDFSSAHKDQERFTFMDECDGMCGV